MKKYLFLSYLLFVLAGMFLLVSCGGDDEPYSDYNETHGNSGSASDPIADIVKSNISASVSYSDFGWNMTINSKLASKLPGKTLTYGTECGYGSYQYYHHFNFKTDYLEKTDGQGNMNICFSLFVGNEYAYEQFYFSSYKELQSRMAKGYTLISDERDLYNSILKIFREKENAAKSKYCGRLYVIIDGIKYFYKTYGQMPSDSGESGSGGSGGSGSSSSYEKPDIGFYDFTATKTSLKVQYKIYNKDESKVTSAKIYYGTSSNPTSSKTATVSGVLITANISGLKAGTTYYVKCVATGKGGATTTTTTRCITNY